MKGSQTIACERLNGRSPRIDPRSVRAVTRYRCRHLRLYRSDDGRRLQREDSWVLPNGFTILIREIRGDGDYAMSRPWLQYAM